MLNADRTTVLELIDVGELPAAKIGRAWVVRQEDLSDYLAERVRRQTAERRARAEDRKDNEVIARNRNRSESAASGRRRKIPPLPEPVSERTSP